MIKPAVLDAMVAAGCTAEQIAAVVKADQAQSTNAERQARFRARRKALLVTDSNVTSVTLRNEPSPKKAVSPTPPLEKTTPTNEGSDEPSSSEPETAPSVVSLPTVSEGEVQILETDVAEWEPAFPAVDVRQQLAAMRAWLVVNPTKRKTRRGMRKFVVGWLDRKQNEARSSPAARSTAPPPPPKPRNPGERAILQLNGTIPHEPPSTDTGRLAQGQSWRQAEGAGDVREIALPPGDFSRGG